MKNKYFDLSSLSIDESGQLQTGNTMLSEISETELSEVFGGSSWVTIDRDKMPSNDACSNMIFCDMERNFCSNALWCHGSSNERTCGNAGSDCGGSTNAECSNNGDYCRGSSNTKC